MFLPLVYVGVGFLGIGGISFGIYKSLTVHKINKQIDQENLKILEQQSELLNQKNSLNKEINQLNSDILNRKLKKKELDEQLLNDTQSYSLLLETNKKISREAMAEYQKTLDNKYNEIELEFDSNVQLMKESYAKIQEDLMRAAAEESAKLDKIRATRAAAQEALLREKEIKEQKDFYCLSLDEQKKKDIQVLKTIEPQLSNVRVLRMLIWQTYIQKPLKALIANILGTNTVCGIYKITNQQTDECYIGQSVTVEKRWLDHAKCGLGIDAPASNKLYASMQQYGIWNFSWELLEECPREELDEKEKYYIDLYDSYNYGFNSNTGNKSKGEK